MPREIQGEEGSVANEETVTRCWEGLCPGELRNPCSSCCGRCITKMQTSPENQSRSWHICSLFWFDTLEIWKLQLDEILPLFCSSTFKCMIVDELDHLPVCQKHSHKAWDFWIGLKTGLKNRVPQHVADEMGLALLLVARQVDSVLGMA